MLKRGWFKLILGVSILLGAVVVGRYWSTRNSFGDINPEAIVVAHRGDLEIVVTETGRIQPLTKVDIKSKVAGQVLNLRVKEGQAVKAGDILLELDPRDLRRNLAQAQADQAILAAELAGLRAGARPEDLQEAKGFLDQANAREHRARVEMERADRALALHSITAVEWETAREQAAEAKAAIVSARSKLKRLQVGARAVEIQQAQARLQKARVAYQSARDQLADTVIRSPISGTVIHRGIQIGELVTPGVSESGNREPLLTVADLSTLVVKSEINQIDVGKVSVGQPVTIRVDTLPGQTFSGEIYKVAPAAVPGRERDVQVFPIETLVKNYGNAKMRPGMGADLDIFIARKQGVLLLPVEAVARDRGGSARVTLVHEHPNRWSREVKQIRLGSSNDQEVEVIEGLTEGDRVLIDPASAKDNVNKF